MALPCSVAFTIASSKPVHQNRNSEILKPILKEFKPKLSISQNHSLASGPLRHPKAIDTDKEGRFEQYLSRDIMGLMSSYEASQPSIRDEETEFTMIQTHHQREIVEISRWWKDLGLSKDLKFARDQPLKWYIWSMSSLTDPSLSEQRIELTKPISMIYIIDDIFDVHGTLDELVCFTEVINRWDIAATEQLPDYMKISFKALDNITNEISYKIYKKHGWNPVDSLRKTWASLCNAFLVEAKWFASGKLPSAEEYLKNGIVSSGVHVVLVHIFFLLGQGTSKETMELIESYPSIISCTATILRLWDDMGSAKDENQDGHDGSYVECYLKENEGSSFEDARNEVLHIISDAWKQLNQECLSPNPFSETFSKASLNIARMVPLMYNYDDDHRLPSLDEHVNLSSKKIEKKEKGKNAQNSVS